MGKFSGKTALVTGASRGLGYAIAKSLAKEGANIIAVARSEADLEQLDDDVQNHDAEGKIIIAALDIAKPGTIDALAVQIAEKFQSLDYLILNAALLGQLRPMSQIPNKEWDKVMHLNVTANMQMIRAFTPLLMQSDASHVLAVTSTVSEKVVPYWGTYAVSKAALDHMIRIYAAEQGDSGVKANPVNPGAMRTHMRAQAFPGEDADSLPSPEEVAQIFLQILGDNNVSPGETISVRDYAAEKCS